MLGLLIRGGDSLQSMKTEVCQKNMLSFKPKRPLLAVCIAFFCGGLWASEIEAFNAFLDETPGPARVWSEPTLLVPHPERTQMEPRLGIPTILWTGRQLSQTRVASLDLEALARSYLSTYAPVYGYSTDVLQSARLRYIHDLGKGPIIVKFRQFIGDLEVYGTEMNVLLGRNQNCLGLTGYLFPHEPEQAAHAFSLDDAEALARAFFDLTNENISVADLVFNKEDAPYRHFDFAAGKRASNEVRMATPARIKKVLFGLSHRYVPAYYLELHVGRADRVDADYAAYVISAQDGSLLLRSDLTVADSFTYKVWASPTSELFVPFDGPTGNGGSPHPSGVPNGFQEDFVASQLVTLEDAAGLGDPWLAAGATETNGNNVDAYIDRFGGDGFDPVLGDFRATTTAHNTFAYDFDFGLDPQTDNASQNAAIVMLFYMNNYLHDVYYEAGFDELAGNAQMDNYGRGGRENDAIKAEGQDGGGQNNANMSTPADGARPRMQMYTFSGSTPDRDGTIDNGISAHEWGHYMHNRLVQVLGTRQSRSMGEGWGDFLALINTVEENDDFEGVYTTGPYATYRFVLNTNYVDNFYFGIRRFPYSTDMTKNALTFRNIGGATSNLPTTPISPLNWQNSGNSEVHNAGEIWCTMLWECYHDLLLDRMAGGSGFLQAKRDMMAYVVSSLKLSPKATTFTEARDALLLAAAATSLADFQIFSEAFARRGIGTGAVSPARASTDHSGVVESFDPILAAPSLGFLGASLSDNPDCDNDGVLDLTETGLLTVQLRNTGFIGLSATTAIVSSPHDVTIGNGGLLVFPASQPTETPAASLEVTFNSGVGSRELAFDIQFTDANPDIQPQMSTVKLDVNYDDLPNERFLDDVESGPNVWLIDQAVGYEPWTIVKANPESSGDNHARYVADVGTSLDSYLIIGPLRINRVGSFHFSFLQRFSFEPGAWDGGVIEFSGDGVTWADVGHRASPGYNGVVRRNVFNPISERPAFVNDSDGYPAFHQVTVDLGEDYQNQTLWFRFRIGCDSAVGGDGWYLDDISFPTLEIPPFNKRITDPDPCLCYLTNEVPLAMLLESLGKGDWPLSRSILNYLPSFNEICQ